MKVSDCKTMESKLTKTSPNFRSLRTTPRSRNDFANTNPLKRHKNSTSAYNSCRRLVCAAWKENKAVLSSLPEKDPDEFEYEAMFNGIENKEEYLFELFINTGKTGDVLDPADGTILPTAPLDPDAIIERFLKLFQNGRASEIINGRSAMVGFTLAWVVELLTGKSVWSQCALIRDVGIKEILIPQYGFYALQATIVIVLIASLVPQARGEKHNGLNVPPNSLGAWTSQVEMVHGRAAMIGMSALMTIEYYSGAPIF